MADTLKTTNVDVLQTDGSTETVGTPSITVLRRDPDSKVLEARGASLPTDGDAGYAKGCKFILTGGSTGTTVYVNEGSSTSADFNAEAALTPSTVNTATIATTSNTDGYVIVPKTGVIASARFSGVDALATSDTNYITFSITNLGQAGSGTTAILAATDANTTKATGGTAIAANTVRSLTLTSTAADLAVTAGDRLRICAAATGTLANTVTFPVYTLLIA